MKTRITLLACLGLALVSFALARTQHATESKLDQLAWLAGGWEAINQPATTEEHWIAPRGGLMLGCGRTLADGRAVFFEFLRLEERPNGDVVYVAHPAARSPGTEFKLTSAADDSWTFENPEHDFPRSIRYTRQADGSLAVHLAGIEKGEPLQQELHLRRIGK